MKKLHCAPLANIGLFNVSSGKVQPWMHSNYASKTALSRRDIEPSDVSFRNKMCKINTVLSLVALRSKPAQLEWQRIVTEQQDQLSHFWAKLRSAGFGCTSYRSVLAGEQAAHIDR